MKLVQINMFVEVNRGKMNKNLHNKLINDYKIISKIKHNQLTSHFMN